MYGKMASSIPDYRNFPLISIDRQGHATKIRCADNLVSVMSGPESQNKSVFGY